MDYVLLNNSYIVFFLEKIGRVFVFGLGLRFVGYFGKVRVKVAVRVLGEKWFWRFRNFDQLSVKREFCSSEVVSIVSLLQGSLTCDTVCV